MNHRLRFNGLIRQAIKDRDFGFAKRVIENSKNLTLLGKEFYLQRLARVQWFLEDRDSCCIMLLDRFIG